MSKDMQTDFHQGDQKPDLRKLYKPVGIQAITAATVCHRELQQKKKNSRKRMLAAFPMD
ncbi:hypothetical protein [Breoghania sp.]|uniref:hypothetical protein n=1 Tax=Breoghania sp. TaxID=2065378 RepID=UPI0029CA52C7|nr:hypothetical protein [Breoghania sp.]